jgi:haloacetate dehalogenase
MFEGFDRRRIEVDGIAINLVVGGSGPPVLMLHGSKPRCTADCANYAFRAMAADQVAAMKRLGFARFHVIGHDRGARTAHRMVLDSPDTVASLAVLDIVPTYTVFNETDRRLASAYWHWYFLSQPEPFPERLIGADPDFFYETCLAGWGATRSGDFDQEMLAEYRRCWRDPAMIHGSCSDYRAAATIDLEHDAADLDRKVQCLTLVMWGAQGVMGRLFDVAAKWRERCVDVHPRSIAGGHFFIDQFPDETARILIEFLSG